MKKHSIHFNSPHFSTIFYSELTQKEINKLLYSYKNVDLVNRSNIGNNSIGFIDFISDGILIAYYDFELSKSFMTNFIKNKTHKEILQLINKEKKPVSKIKLIYKRIKNAILKIVS
jgi:hypothetical protein